MSENTQMKSYKEEEEHKQDYKQDSMKGEYMEKKSKKK